MAKPPSRKWQPASAEWTDAFARAVAGRAGIEQRKMFGYPAIFLNGNMVAGLHEQGLVLRLSEPDRQALISSGATTFEPMAGRPMKEYVVAPESLARDHASLGAWLDKSVAFVASKPPKPPKSGKA